MRPNESEVGAARGHLWQLLPGRGTRAEHFTACVSRSRRLRSQSYLSFSLSLCGMCGLLEGLSSVNHLCKPGGCMRES